MDDVRDVGRSFELCDNVDWRLDIMVRCDGCGLETSVPGLLRERRRSFSRKRVKLCGACQANSLKHVQRANWMIYGICMVFIAMLGWLRGDLMFVVSFAGFLAAIVVFSTVSVLIHELGHAVVARALGWQVCGVVMGFGRLLWQSRVGDTLLQWRFIQTGGMTLCVPSRNERLFPLQAFLIFAAGPLVNGLAAWAGWVLFRQNDVALESGPSLAGMWVFLNLFNAGVNMLPFKSSAGGATIGSDGYQMIQAITKPGALRESYIYGSEIVRFSTLRQLGELDAAGEAVDRHLRRYAWDLGGNQCLSVVQSDLGNYADCAKTARHGLWLLDSGQGTYPPVMPMEKSAFSKLLEAGFRCNLAHAILKGKVGDPAEALTLAREAYESLPWMYGIQHTYGYALAMNGDVDEGLKLMSGDRAKLGEEPEHARREIRETILEIKQMAG